MTFWQPPSTIPRDNTPVFLRVGGCVSAAIYNPVYGGWEAHADGYAARDHKGRRVIIYSPDAWAYIPDNDLYP